MTIEKSKTINIPVWIISILLPVFFAAITAYGIYQASGAEVRTQTENNSKQIELLQTSKVDRNEINLILQQLERIESKVDKISEKKD